LLGETLLPCKNSTGCHPDCIYSTISTTASTTASTTSGSNAGLTFSNSKERECSKDQMTNLKISPLSTSGEALQELVLTLKWSLTGDCWYHDGKHATTNISVTTPNTKALSKNGLMLVLRKAMTKHTSTSHLINAGSLLQDHINGVHGMPLIARGKGFKMYHLLIKSGFLRGLGTEAITHLTECVSVTQHSLESIGLNHKERVWSKSDKFAAVV
jgi:hypothetical protein